MRRKSQKFIFLAIFLILIGLSCQTVENIINPGSIPPEPTLEPLYTPYPTFTPKPAMTLTPTGVQIDVITDILQPEPTEGPPPTGMLFSDGFGNPASGWDTGSWATGSSEYYSGGFRIVVTQAGFARYSNPGLFFTDVRIEVDADLIGGEEDNYFGVICRYQNPDNFYALLINSKGYYAIRKRVGGGSFDFISGDSFLVAGGINLGGEPNHITAVCEGNKLSLSINGSLIAEVEDGDISSGDVGLIVGTITATSTEILFDNFEVHASP